MPTATVEAGSAERGESPVNPPDSRNPAASPSKAGREEAGRDRELVEAFAAGDAAAFEALYERHRDWVLALAFRLTGDHALACDVLQETFLYFLRKFPGFRLTAQLRTFLYPVVKNHCVSAGRRARRFEPNGEAALGRLVSPDALPVGVSAAEFAAALASLSDDHREVVLMRFVDGLALAEIAQALDAPLGTIKSRLHHALALLRADRRTRKFFGVED